MDTDSLVLLLFFSPLVLLALIEAVRPGSAFGRGRPWSWVLKGGVWFVSSFAISNYVPVWVDGWLARYALLDLSFLGWGGILPGVMAYQLVGYANHRALHEVPALWRFHRTHHSSERIDVFSTFIFHPLDIAGWTLVGSIAVVGLTGISVEAAIATALINNAAAAVGHANIRTPRWLGYIVARPENHALHHGRGVHSFNFADFPVVDILFGTFRNPETFPAEAGFVDGGSNQVGRLLLGLEPQPRVRVGGGDA
ncbi:MAG: sterol desaturase family protein [Myxococcota bacterium]